MRQIIYRTLGLLLLVSGVLLAQTQISGVQTGNLGPGNYLVIGDIEVPAGQTLTIAPGTVFLHNGHYTWNINGVFTAVGTAADSISFIRKDAVPAHQWGGLRFSGSATGSELDFCIIDNCKNTGFVAGGGIYLNTLSFSISNSRISNCSTEMEGGGIFAESCIPLIISNCRIIYNEARNRSNGGGIQIKNCMGTEIRSNIIAYNTASGD